MTAHMYDEGLPKTVANFVALTPLTFIERAASVYPARPAIVHGEIRRFELPHLSALQFVCEGALAGGVTTSLAMDAHGKTLSYALLEMEI